MMKKEEKFKNEQFNGLYELMKEMDSSDDYLAIHVSSLNPGKDTMEMHISMTGRTGGKETLETSAAEAVLIMAMDKDDVLKRLLTDAVMYYEQVQAFKRMRQS